MSKKLVAGLCIGVLAVVGCSGDDDSDDASSSSTIDTTVELTGLDADFGDGGILASPLSTTAHDRFISVVPGPDGTYYLAGFTSEGDDHAMAVMRVTAEGEADDTFGEAGIVSVNVAEGGGDAEVARGIAVQPDGHVVISGPAEHDPAASGEAAEDTDVAVVRIDEKGKLDTSFGDDGIARIDLGAGRAVAADTYIADNAWGLVSLDDDKLVVFGATPAASSDRTDTDFALVGLTGSGEKDTEFGTAGVVTVDVDTTIDNPRNIKVQDDGKLVATGYSRDGDGVVSPVIIRAAPDGTLDDTFGEGGIATAKVLPGVAESYQVGFQDDAYVLAGYGRGADSNEKVDLVSFRFKADGTWDQTYGTNGVTRIDLAAQDDRARNLTILPDGRVLIVGSGKMTADNVDAMVVLLDKDGKPVPSFGTDGHVLSDLGGPADAWFGVAVADDGESITLAGFKGTDDTSGGNDDGAIARIALS